MLAWYLFAAENDQRFGGLCIASLQSSRRRRSNPVKMEVLQGSCRSCKLWFVLDRIEGSRWRGGDMRCDGEGSLSSISVIVSGQFCDFSDVVNELPDRVSRTSGPFLG